MERDFLGQIFEKKKPSSDTKFHENPSCGSRVVPCGKTGRQTWRSLRVALLQFCERAKKIQSLPRSKYAPNQL